jgi:hypothetical protein
LQIFCLLVAAFIAAATEYPWICLAAASFRAGYRCDWSLFADFVFIAELACSTAGSIYFIADHFHNTPQHQL